MQRLFAIGLVGLSALPSGCSSSLSSSPEPIQEPVVVQATTMKQVTIAVSGMTWPDG